MHLLANSQQVHYGHASLVATCSLPVLYVFPRMPLVMDAVVSAVAERVPQLLAAATSSVVGAANAVLPAVLIPDQSLSHAAPALLAALTQHPGCQVGVDAVYECRKDCSQPLAGVRKRTLHVLLQSGNAWCTHAGLSVAAGSAQLHGYPCTWSCTHYCATAHGGGRLYLAAARNPFRSR